LLAVLLSAAALAACGENSESSSSAPSSGTGKATTQGSGQDGGKSGGGSPEKSKGKSAEEADSGSGTSAPTAPLEISGGGSAQFRVKGGDNSIQNFGEESDESELEEAATALHDFYVARVRGEWQRACSKLSQLVADQLQTLASGTKQSGKGCSAILARLTPSLPPSVQRESTVVDAGSLRVEGDRGFLIYRGAEGTVYAINMALEDDVWKVGALAGVPLS